MISPRHLPLAALLLTAPAHAQFDLEESRTTVSLRGIATAGPLVAWAGGAAGTVLRTVDEGRTWLPCTVPPNAEKLDFRGVQALDANTAIVMSSGKGDLSRIYKTADACKTWKLVFTNPDPEGFFDTIRRVTEHQFYVLGDPVAGKFAIFLSPDTAATWFIADDPGLEAEKGDGAFAASNSSLLAVGPTLYFGTGGTNAAHVYATRPACPGPPAPTNDQTCPIAWVKSDVPIASHAAASGVFSLAGRTETSPNGRTQRTILVAVGGTYDKPEDATATAATSPDGGKTWAAATLPPSGYRSAVAFDRLTQEWIAVGTGGADVSRDDGKTWHPLPASPTDPPDTARGWNAIALPYVVGSKGRIGKLRQQSLEPAR